MKNYVKLFAAFAVVAMLAACGGGGGNAGTTPGSVTPPGGTATASVSDFALFTDKNSITNSGSDTAKITVVAVDANRNAVAGSNVTVSTDQQSVFTPAGTTMTDAAGLYSGLLSIGADKSDRDIIVAVTVNGIVKKTSVRVTGSRLTLQVTPSNPAPSQAVSLVATLVDSASIPIRGVNVSFTGGIPQLQSAGKPTDINGQITATFAAPATAGGYTIGAAAGGVISSDYQLQVFNSAIPAAVIPAGNVPSLAASPNVLAVNSPGSSASQATLRFLFVDVTNRPVQNVRVRFVDRTTGTPTNGSSIVSGNQTLYSDIAGTASTQYIAGQNVSPTNGISLRACYSANDFTSLTDCPAFVDVSLTIAGQALAVSVGDDNLLTKGAGTYIKRFAVTVADSAGRAVANAPVDISVDLTHYGKGAYIYGGTYYTAVSGTTGVASLLVVPNSLTGYYPSKTATPGVDIGGRIWCANEDTNRNGIADAGENIDSSVDSNGQATIEPRKSDLLVSYADPAVTKTNASGVLEIKVEYSQRFATWLAYKVRVTANVAGSQGMAERLFVTSFVEGDDKNGSFLTTPYGIQSCSTAN